MIEFNQFIAKLPKIKPILQVASEYLAPIDISPIDDTERDKAILSIIKTLLDSPHSMAGASRAEDWNNGWLENLLAYKASKNVDSLNPKYYGKYPYIRYDSTLWRIGSPDAELSSVRMLMHYIYERFLCCNKYVVELGCGTGHHLYQLSTIDPTNIYYGLDWSESSQQIIESYQSHNPETIIIGKNIDFFCPPSPDNYIPKGSSLYTFAALEQISDRHEQIIDFMIASRPKIVVHLEPIEELLDQDRILEYLSVKYFKKRNYLSGFLTALRKRQENGEIKILHEHKTGVGSLYIEGYSLVVWTVSE
jgi:hypothetical protein